MICSKCEGICCGDYDGANFRLKRVVLPDGTFSNELKDIMIVDGSIKDCKKSEEVKENGSK